MHLLALALTVILAAPIIGKTDIATAEPSNAVVEDEEPPSTDKPAKRLTWRDNPNQCTDDEWIRADNLECLPKSKAQPVASGSVDNCNREEWLRAVGIPESVWGAVDGVINGEGGWCGVTRWNTAGSGAYGICQSLPATKMASAGSDYMTNGLTQLKWCNQYAQGYGGWPQALAFKQCTGWCYSARAGVEVYKDHAWW